MASRQSTKRQVGQTSSKALTAIAIPYEQLEANAYRLSSTEEEHIPDDEETETERDFQEEEEFEGDF